MNATTSEMAALVSREGYEGVLRMLAEAAISDAGDACEGNKAAAGKWVGLIQAIEKAAKLAAKIEG